MPTGVIEVVWDLAAPSSEPRGISCSDFHAADRQTPLERASPAPWCFMRAILAVLVEPGTGQKLLS